METWESTLVSPKTTILEAMKIINNTQLLIAIVVDENRRLLGTVTDGDIRRGILRNEPMDSPVERIMFKMPVYASRTDSRKKILNLMKLKGCLQIPVLNDEKQVIDVRMSTDYISAQKEITSPVLLMAGGMGTRLRPLTDDCPKPLLCIGDKPILEIILENFIEYGFKNFFISINYKGEMIEDYFKDGNKWGIKITYLREKKRLGTAGALSLIKDKFSGPIIVMNGDLLTQINFDQLLNFHKNNHTKATLCVREYDFQVPFGVVQVQDYKLKELKEKPVHKQFINAGIYVLEQDALKIIPEDQYFDMPDLLSRLVELDEKPAVFPIHEYWLDIGQMVDYKRADKEYVEMVNNIKTTAI
ncbi:MAG: nucleotidyltransferase family protein [Proteobacteria bacterium]|nr:nucleotidyltransferase family protein [Pseudomonadota bacterium]